MKMFKSAIIGSPVHLTNQKNVKKNIPVHFFVSMSLQVCEKWATQILLPRDIENGYYYNITAP